MFRILTFVITSILYLGLNFSCTRISKITYQTPKYHIESEDHHFDVLNNLPLLFSKDFIYLEDFPYLSYDKTYLVRYSLEKTSLDTIFSSDDFLTDLWKDPPAVSNDGETMQFSVLPRGRRKTHSRYDTVRVVDYNKRLYYFCNLSSFDTKLYRKNTTEYYHVFSRDGNQLAFIQNIYHDTSKDASKFNNYSTAIKLMDLKTEKIKTLTIDSLSFIQELLSYRTDGKLAYFRINISKNIELNPMEYIIQDTFGRIEYRTLMNFYQSQLNRVNWFVKWFPNRDDIVYFKTEDGIKLYNCKTKRSCYFSINVYDNIEYTNFLISTDGNRIAFMISNEGIVRIYYWQKIIDSMIKSIS